MTPEQAIADLDSFLAADGESVRLQRLTGTAQIPFEVVCQAFLRGYLPNELVNIGTGVNSGILQQDVKVILSPTEINDAQWPGASTTGELYDRRIPRKGDRLFTTRGPMTVQSAAGLYMAGTLVRIEASARGQQTP